MWKNVSTYEKRQPQKQLEIYGQTHKPYERVREILNVN